jgi:hypothetical protein
MGAQMFLMIIGPIKIRQVLAFILAFAFVFTGFGRQVSQDPSLKHRSKAWEIVQSSVIPPNVFPFLPEDLASLRDHSRPWFRTVDRVTNQALADFAIINSRPAVSDMDKAIAVTDWVARTLRHPSFYPKPEESLPAYRPAPDKYLETHSANAYQILSYVLAADPMDSENWPSPYCSHQNRVASLMMNFLGYYCRLIDCEAHTGMEFYSWQARKWIWCESTFNEHYVYNTGHGFSLPLSVRELHDLERQGLVSRIVAVKHGYPETIYINVAPQGFYRYLTHSYMKLVGPLADITPKGSVIMVSEDSPLLTEDSLWVPGVPNALKPAPVFREPQIFQESLLNESISGLGLNRPIIQSDEGIKISLVCQLPNVTSFEVWKESIKVWEKFDILQSNPTGYVQFEPPLLDWDSGLVRIRGQDAVGNYSNEFIIHLFP